MVEGVLNLSDLHIGSPEGSPRLRVLRVQFERPLPLLDRLARLAQAPECVGGLAIGGRVVGLQFGHPAPGLVGDSQPP